MIQIINTEISKNTNRKIIDNLFKYLIGDLELIKFLNTNVNKKDSGLILDTLTFNNDILNTYANVIFNIVEKDTFMKFKKIQRIYWNWYHPGSIDRISL
jgi:hypothetical protein